ncbi:kinase-like domain-containing protein [Obelidium mucronatum]|nr:kinase-like domain-containing protein [Obelidium mucronatum]
MHNTEILELCVAFQENKANIKKLFETTCLAAQTLQAIPQAQTQVQPTVENLKQTLNAICEYLKRETLRSSNRNHIKKVTLHDGVNLVNLALSIKSLTLDEEILQIVSDLQAFIKKVASELTSKSGPDGSDGSDGCLKAKVTYILKQRDLNNIDESDSTKKYLQDIETWDSNHEKTVAEIASKELHLCGLNPIQTGIYFETFVGVYLHESVSVKKFSVPQDASKTATDVFQKELKCWKELSSKRFVQTLIGFVPVPALEPKLVAEFCPWQIDEYIKKHPKQVFRALFQLASGIEQIHGTKIDGKFFICHKDLAPRNVLVRVNGTIAISDFGMSRQTANEISRCTTVDNNGPKPPLNYASPEVVTSPSPVNSAADIWSLGMIAYALLTKCEPYAGKTDEEIKDNFFSAKIQLPQGLTKRAENKIFGDCSLQPLWSLIDLCLVTTPKGRITATQMKAVLKDVYKSEIEILAAKFELVKLPDRLSQLPDWFAPPSSSLNKVPLVVEGVDLADTQVNLS